MAVTVVGHGVARGRVRIAYTFANGGTGVVDVRLEADADHVEIREQWQLADAGGEPLAAWQFDLDQGWAPRQAMWTTHGSGAGKAANEDVQRAPLADDLTRLAPVVVELIPRWNQAFDDGWLYGVSDGQQAVAAVVMRAGLWRWPHAHPVLGRAHADHQADLVLPVGDNARAWLLLATNDGAIQRQALVSRLQKHAFQDLDKLNREYVLTWGDQKPRFRSEFPFSSMINPTGFWRQQGRRELREAAGKRGKGGPEALTWAQSMLDPDTYGSSWLGWSPENPNFLTDFLKRPVSIGAQLEQHPSWPAIRDYTVMRLREDLFHAVTLPGGAGQECPGYLNHALGVWRKMAPLVKQVYGYDLTQDPRFIAAGDFLRRTSVPAGSGRTFLPMGDTHPGRNGPNGIDVNANQVRSWVSEEFPGFGVILRANPGTPQETYLAFKSGPNRGHYHGDQLAIHYAANAQPLAVDHHCSYKPRAGQEHMHNRVSFGTADVPFANMDGYERTVAFETSDIADLVIGEVASPRLRAVRELPPEAWDQVLAAVTFDQELVYRRAIALVKGLDVPVVVLIDEWSADREVQATYNLHVRGDAFQATEQRVAFDNLTLHILEGLGADGVNHFPWEHTNGGREVTQGARIPQTGRSGRFMTVLVPKPFSPTIAYDAEAGIVRIDDVTITIAGAVTGSDEAVSLTVQHGSQSVAITGLDRQRSQGAVGLFVPDAGYPFGPIPAWLKEQRSARPQWFIDWQAAHAEQLPFPLVEDPTRW